MSDCHCFTVADRSITFEFGDEWVGEKAARLIAGWHFAARADDEASPFIIRLSRAQAPTIPSALAAFAVNQGHCHSDGDSLYLTTSDSLMRAHPSGVRLVEAWIGEETSRSATSFARLMFYATQAALRRCGLYELHAAGVCDSRRDYGVLFIGASGSGKTTLAMRLASAGWSNVGDDLVLIREQAQTAEAFAFRRVFAASDTTLEACSTPGIEEATREPSDFEPSKRRLDPEVLYPGSFASSCTPRLLVFPTISGHAESEARPLQQPEALTRLLRMCPWATYDKAVARPHMSALARLANQCASYELFGGTDLLNDPLAAPRMIDALSGGAR